MLDENIEKADGEEPGAYPMVCREMAKMMREKYPALTLILSLIHIFNNWLVSVFAPIFGGQSTIMLLLICVVFITVVTQVVNGNVLTMGMTPIIVRCV